MQQKLKCEFEIVLLRAEATNCAGVVFTIAMWSFLFLENIVRKYYVVQMKRLSEV